MPDSPESLRAQAAELLRLAELAERPYESEVDPQSPQAATYRKELKKLRSQVRRYAERFPENAVIQEAARQHGAAITTLLVEIIGEPIIGE